VDACAIEASNKRELRREETIMRSVKKRKDPGLNLQAENRAAQLRRRSDLGRVKIHTSGHELDIPFSGTQSQPGLPT
jgi:hypothetical protein